MKPSIIKVLEYYGAIDVPEGLWRPMLCPFHDDHNKSASVHTEFQAFKCMACDVQGDSYKIVMLQEGVSFRDAQQFIVAHIDREFDSKGGNVSKPARKQYRPSWL